MYALGLNILYKNRQYNIVQDRVITDLSYISDDEFIFASIANLHFATNYKEIEKTKNIIGFWHTLLANTSYDLSNLFIQIKPQNKQAGAFLQINNNVVVSGICLAGANIPNHINLEVAELLEFSSNKIKNIVAIKSPIEIDKKHRAKRKKFILSLLVLWAVVFIVIATTYFILQQKNSVILASITKAQYRLNLVNTGIDNYKKINYKKSKYTTEHLNILNQLLLCPYANMQGDINFDISKASLVIDDKDIECLTANNSDFNIIQKPKKTTINWSIKNEY